MTLKAKIFLEQCWVTHTYVIIGLELVNNHIKPMGDLHHSLEGTKGVKFVVNKLTLKDPNSTQFQFNQFISVLCI